MKTLIAISICVFYSMSCTSQIIDVSGDSLDFLPQDGVYLRVIATDDTLNAHELTISALIERTSPVDTSFSTMSSSDAGTWAFDYGNGDAILVDGSELFSDFILGSSQTFELVLYEQIGIKVGDDFSEVREVFPHAASREVTNSPHGVNGIYLPYFVKKPDGEYYVADVALFFENDLATDRVLSISPTP